jgi:hypothetical protein
VPESIVEDNNPSRSRGGTNENNSSTNIKSAEIDNDVISPVSKDG